jgi:hypothetical protein
MALAMPPIIPGTSAHYNWAEHADRLGYDEPGHTMIPTERGYDIDTCLTHMPIFLEGLWAGLYGHASICAQEN